MKLPRWFGRYARGGEMGPATTARQCKSCGRPRVIAREREDIINGLLLRKTKFAKCGHEQVTHTGWLHTIRNDDDRTEGKS